ncbi:pyrimidine 5'-nucleotidase [Glaciimonas soli]|uniref:phosphoglycolate phosphatase n=1 Tax=Glaciimonas soli TaxID=2590999 RepID=A0A843YL22_9BURK|nr:pyrimidine 5'-nucleotidase [Glaciimonas soli]MQR00559.1 pyrimidine 5'-nucleotidase [Glaciimonas soli]
MLANTTPLWLFDLDNTLHNASYAIFPAIHENMNRYLARVLGVDGVDADAATVDATRTKYWQLYGATLLGMIKHHQVRPEDFLREAHRFDDLHGMIRGERGLINLLKRLPGRKILLTNAPLDYSQQIMRHFGLQRHVAKHISIESMFVHGQLRPKPSPQLLRKICSRERISPQHCILVEDTLANLKSAKKVGMRTVWVTGYLPKAKQSSALIREKGRPIMSRRVGGVDVQVKSVRRLVNHVHRLR